MKTINQLLLTVAALTLTACVGNPEPTTFVLRNDGESDIYRNSSRWLSLEVDGVQASLTEPFCMSECTLVQTTAIACELGAEYPTVVRMAPGAELTQEWDGTYYEFPEGRNCYKKRQRAADFVASFCYSHEFESFNEILDETGDVIGGATLKDATCEEVTFERGVVVDLLAE